MRSTSEEAPSEETRTRPVLDMEMPSPCGWGGSVTVPTSSNEGNEYTDAVP